MSDYMEVVAIVEGRTEQIFIERILKPYLAAKNIFMTATQISKPGQKGGDVKFSRAERDIGRFLKQRADIYVTQFFDYYGLKEWPNLETITNQNHIEIATLLNDGAVEKIKQNHTNIDIDKRFIPYMAMHEFETLLFSDEAILANALNVNLADVNAIVEACGEPEKINNSRETAPSKRLNNLKPSGKFKKTTEGITIAEQIGIDKMRARCPLFNEWLNKIEATMEAVAGDENEA
jgi:hypothetical protein